MKIRLFEDLLDPTLVSAASAVQFWPSASITQHIAWPSIAVPSRLQRYLGFCCTDEAGQTISVGCVRLTQLWRGRFSASIRRGPCTQSPEDLGRVMPALEAALHKYGAISISANPIWKDEDAQTCEAVLAQMGYKRVPEYEQTLPTATALVDVQISEEDLLRSFSTRRKRDLRAARADNMLVRSVKSFEEAVQLTKIMREMAKRTGLEIDGRHDFRAQFHFLKERPHLGLINVAYLDDKIVGGSVSFFEGDRNLLNIVTAVPGLKGGRSTSLYWRAMLDAKNRGCRWLDLDGYPDPREPSDPCEAGRQEFKDSYKPQIVTLPPMMSRVLRPIEALTYRKIRRLYRKSKWKTQIKALLQQPG